MRILSRFCRLAIFLGAALAVGTAAGGGNVSRRLPAQPKPKPIVIVAEVVNGRVSYTVNSKPARPDLLRVLSILEQQRGRAYPVVALVDAHARITEFGNVEGTAGKAGFFTIRFFLFNRESGKMGEITFGPSIPFSTNPPAE